MTRLCRPAAQYYLIASVAILAGFGLIPAALYLHAGEPWSFPATLLLRLGGFGLLGLLAVAVLIRGLALISARAAALVAILLFCLGTFLLLAHVYAPIQIGPLDGSPLVSNEPLRHTLFEAVLLAALVVVFGLLLRGRGLAIASLFSAALWLIGAGYAGAVAWTTGDEEPRRAARASHSERGNVYHFVLDTLQTDAFRAAAERLDLAGRLTGFDLYANNISNYINTVPSSASYFTGTLYQNGKYRKWVKAWRRRGLFPTVRRAGYTTSMYAPFSYWDNRHVDRFWHNIALYEEETGVGPAHFYDFGQVWLASLAPNFLTNESLAFAAGLRDRLFPALTGGAIPLSIETGLDQYASVLMLERLIREEPARPASGQYVYAHAVLPHGPHVIDPECRYVGKREPGSSGRADGYLDQTVCALRLVAAFLDQLRALGRYDRSTVLIHADTGSRIGFLDQRVRDDGAETLGKSSYLLRSQVYALLAIKPPDARGPLKVRTAPTQLVDLFPTVLDLLELPPPRYRLHGRSVYAAETGLPREARFGFDPARRHGWDLIEVRVDAPADLPHSTLTVLGPATDPAIWRGRLRAGG